jgi:hypothetical protein
MPERIDLGPCQAIRHDHDPGRMAILLPGQFYPTRAPVLWFAREAVTARGWSALEVLGEPGLHDDPLGWERECAEHALAAASEARVLIIGKSLASLLAAIAVERDLPAAWLTPLLTESAVTDPLADARRPTLLIGGTADSLWQAKAIPPNPALEVVEIQDADHAIQVPGDLSRSLQALRRVTDAVGTLAHRLS